MHIARKTRSLLFIFLLCSSSLASGRFSASYGQQDPESTIYLPLIEVADACVEAQLAEPLAENPNCPPPGNSSGVGRGDFNKDGFADLAVGVAREDVSPSPGVTIEDAGAVTIIYGSANGLSAQNNQFWHQDSPGVEGQAEAYDYFGSSLAAGDFNGDEFSDLAIGVSGEDVGTVSNAGAVNVLYGSANGLSATNNQIWNQGSSVSGTLLDTSEQTDRFGSALTWGYFNKDSFGDLAVGVVYEDITDGSGNNRSGTGAVNVIYGSASGLQSGGNQFWHQDSASIAGINEESDFFGYSVTGGNFNGDGFTDLAIGAPNEDLTAGNTVYSNAGAVIVIYGSVGGLAATGNQVWAQDSGGIQGEVEAGDYFGMSLSSGDFNRDQRADLAVGVPYEDIDNIVNAGAVNIIYGSANGLTATDDQVFHQNSLSNNGEVDNDAETGDAFGFSLAAGDFDGDNYRDLAIGVPREDIRVYVLASFTDFIDAGGINILSGYTGGLTTEPNNFLHGKDFPHHPNAPCCVLHNAYFGDSLSAWNFGKGTESDLAVGVPGRSTVGIFYGPLMLDATSNENWGQDSPGIEDADERGDGFGDELY